MNFLIMRKKGNVVYVVFCKKSIMLISVLQVLCTTNSSKATTRGCFLESFVEGKNKTKSVSLNVRTQRQVQSMPQGVKSSVVCALTWPLLDRLSTMHSSEQLDPCLLLFRQLF